MHAFSSLILLLCFSAIHATGITYIYGGIFDEITNELITLDPPDSDVQIEGVSAGSLTGGTYIESLGTIGVTINPVTATATGYYTANHGPISISPGAIHQEDFYLLRDPAFHKRTITVRFGADAQPITLTPASRPWYATSSASATSHIFELLPDNETVTLGRTLITANN